LAAARTPGSRVATEGAVGDRFDLGQERGQGAGGSGLGRAAFAPDEHSADLGVNSVEYQSASHALLSDDGGKWENRWHWIKT
jgi:hypothetical protein